MSIIVDLLLLFFILLPASTFCCFRGRRAPEGYPAWQYKTNYVEECWIDTYGSRFTPRCGVKEVKELKKVHFDPRTGEEYTEPVGRWLMRNVFTGPPPQTVTPGPGIDIGTDGNYVYENGNNKIPTSQRPDYISLDHETAISGEDLPIFDVRSAKNKSTIEGNNIRRAVLVGVFPINQLNSTNSSDFRLVKGPKGSQRLVLLRKNRFNNGKKLEIVPNIS